MLLVAGADVTVKDKVEGGGWKRQMNKRCLITFLFELFELTRLSFNLGCIPTYSFIHLPSTTEW